MNRKPTVEDDQHKSFDANRLSVGRWPKPPLERSGAVLPQRDGWRRMSEVEAAAVGPPRG